MDHFDVRSSHLRKIVRTPEFSVPVINQSIQQNETVDWQGLQIKDLNTPGEKSATGMESERGVYVFKSADEKGPLTGYFFTNDVIFGINEFPTNNLNELWNAMNRTDCKQQIRVTVVRNQKKQSVVIPGNTLKP